MYTLMGQALSANIVSSRMMMLYKDVGQKGILLPNYLLANLY